MTTQPSDAAPGLTPELEEAIRRGYAQRDRADMGPTIAYFESLLAEHPGHPVLVYEVAGAYDTAGQEEKARELYEQAMNLGLGGDTLRRCLCQYGSTLRWLGQYSKSLAALDRAKEEWPESDAVRVFRALTLNDASRSDEAVAELMTVITAHAEVTDLGRWAEGLRGLAQWLADGRSDSLLSHELGFMPVLANSTFAFFADAVGRQRRLPVAPQCHVVQRVRCLEPDGVFWGGPG